MEQCPEQTGGPGRSLFDIRTLLSQAHHAQQNYFYPCMKPIKLGPGQPKLLSYLQPFGPSAQSSMAEYFGLDAAAVSRMLNALRENGFVTIHKGTDYRTKLVSLLEVGKQVLAKWEQVCDDEVRAMLKGLSDQDIACFKRCLQTAHHNLINADQGGGSRESKR